MRKIKLFLIFFLIFATGGCASASIYFNDNLTVQYYSDNELKNSISGTSHARLLFHRYGFELDDDDTINIKWVNSLENMPSNYVAIYIPWENKIKIKRFFVKFKSYGDEIKKGVIAHEVAHDLLYSTDIYYKTILQEYICAIVEISSYSVSFRKKVLDDSDMVLSKENFRHDIPMSEIYALSSSWQVAVYKHFIKDGGKFFKYLLKGEYIIFPDPFK
jgi:hypothetical protein